MKQKLLDAYIFANSQGWKSSSALSSLLAAIVEFSVRTLITDPDTWLLDIFNSMSGESDSSVNEDKFWTDLQHDLGVCMSKMSLMLSKDMAGLEQVQQWIKHS